MRIDRLLGTHRRRRVIAAAGAITVAVGVMSGASPAFAAIWASNTAVIGSLSGDGSSVTLTAEVSFLNGHNGIIITPSGNVHFTDNEGDDLGTQTLPRCVNTVCSVSETVLVSSLTSGTTQIFGNYSGDTLLKPSSGMLAFTPCNGSGECSAGAFVPGADVQVNSDSTTGSLEASMGGPGLPCGVNKGGPVANVDAEQLNAGKSIIYTLQGAGAQAYNTQISATSHSEWFCYVSPNEFDAYSQGGGKTAFPDTDASYATFGPAPQIVGGDYSGEYAGLLGHCDETLPPPCIATFSVYNNSDSGQWELYVILNVPSGDPHMGGLKLNPPTVAGKTVG